MNADTLSRLVAQCHDRLTRSEQRLATYLLENFEEAAFLSAAEVGARLHLSEATVARFARALGLSGYPELRRLLEELFREKATHAGRLRTRLQVIGPEADVLEKVIASEIDYLADALRSVSRDGFSEAVQTIGHAPRVFAYGLSGSAMLAGLMQHRLRRFGIPVETVTQSGREACEQLLELRAGDVFFAMIFRQVTDVTLTTLAYARERGCKIIVLTDTLGHTLAGSADVLLEARRGPAVAFHSLIVPVAIVEALIIAVASVKEEQTTETLDRLDEIRSRFNFTPALRMP